MVSLPSLSDLPFFFPLLAWQGLQSPKDHLFFCSWTFYSPSILNQLLPDSWKRLRAGKVLMGRFL